MRKRLQQLTDRQLQIMDVIWERGSATATDVHHALRRTRLARKTIATLLTRLEQHRLLTHDVDGREFVYRPLVSREQVARAKVRSVLDLVLAGDVTLLVRHALEADEVEPGDIEKVEALLRRHADTGE